MAVARAPPLDKGRWIEKAEDEWGAWGTVYYDDDGRVLGSMQYGPARLFPRAPSCRPGRRRDDAMLVTCAYLVDESSPWVLQSLFLAAIGEARDRGRAALEAFAYRYPEGESSYERFRVHKTVFPRDFLADFGFRMMRAAGRVELGAARARRAAAGRRGHAREGAPRREGGVRRPRQPRPGSPHPAASTRRATPGRCPGHASGVRHSI